MGYVVPFDRRVLMDIFVPPGQEGGASPGEMVTVELTRWPTSTRGAIGRVAEVLGDIDAPGVDTEIIIRKFGIPDAHSAEAVAEADEARRVGLRARHPRAAPISAMLVTVTIDGEHARDFDDAITIERLPNGHLLARRAHRRRLALRAGGERARSRGVRARHVGVFPRARGPHVPVGAGDGALQPQSPRRPARAVVLHGGRSPRRRRPVPSSTTASSTATSG